MSSERINSWLSLIANVGVLVGIALLAAELRHNTLATQRMLYQEQMNYGREHSELLVGDENERLASIVFRGEAEPGSLSAEEFEKFILFTAWRMGVWESTFMNRQDGLTTERNWESWDAWYSGLLSRGPGYQAWWDATRHGYDKAFQGHVDRAFISARPTQKKS